MEKIYAKVIQILNETHIVIDKGYKDGVEQGNSVFFEHKAEIVNRITGERYGEYTQNSYRLSIIEVEENYSICVSNMMDNYYFNDLGGYSFRALPVDPKENENINLEGGAIHIGDEVYITNPPIYQQK